MSGRLSESFWENLRTFLMPFLSQLFVMVIQRIQMHIGVLGLSFLCCSLLFFHLLFSFRVPVLCAFWSLCCCSFISFVTVIPLPRFLLPSVLWYGSLLWLPTSWIWFSTMSKQFLVHINWVSHFRNYVLISNVLVSQMYFIGFLKHK